MSAVHGSSDIHIESIAVSSGIAAHDELRLYVGIDSTSGADTHCTRNLCHALVYNRCEMASQIKSFFGVVVIIIRCFAHPHIDGIHNGETFDRKRSSYINIFSPISANTVCEYTSINLGLSGRIERGIPGDGRSTVRGSGGVMLKKGISYEGSRATFGHSSRSGANVRST